jgi:hypothetical protein
MMAEGRRHAGQRRDGHTCSGDRGYDSDALRTALAERSAWANIKPMPRRVDVPVYSRYIYRSET